MKIHNKIIFFFVVPLPTVTSTSYELLSQRHIFNSNEDRTTFFVFSSSNRYSSKYIDDIIENATPIMELLSLNSHLDT